MKMLIRFAVVLLACTHLGGEAFALTASQAQISNAGTVAVKVRHHGYRHHHYGAPYSNWCAYNCFAVRPGTRPPLGAYHYSQYPYDQDIPAHYRWDWDASPIDNALASAYPVTGEPFMRLFERSY